MHNFGGRAICNPDFWLGSPCMNLAIIQLSSKFLHSKWPLLNHLGKESTIGIRFVLKIFIDLWILIHLRGWSQRPKLCGFVVRERLLVKAEGSKSGVIGHAYRTFFGKEKKVSSKRLSFYFEILMYHYLLLLFELYTTIPYHIPFHNKKTELYKL